MKLNFNEQTSLQSEQFEVDRDGNVISQLLCMHASTLLLSTGVKALRD